MKRELLTIAIATMVTTLSFSQGNYIALKGGLNLANVSIKTIGATGIAFPETQRVARATFGIAFNRMLSDNIAIQPEIAYHGAGFKFKSGAGATFNYLAVPVLLKYHPTETHSLIKFWTSIRNFIGR